MNEKVKQFLTATYGVDLASDPFFLLAFVNFEIGSLAALLAIRRAAGPAGGGAADAAIARKIGNAALSLRCLAVTVGVDVETEELAASASLGAVK